MKKQSLFGLVVLLLVIVVTSCQKKTELSKTISPDKVIIRGPESKYFTIQDSIEVKLVPIGEDGNQWTVSAKLPLKKTTAWNDVHFDNLDLNEFISGTIIYESFIDKDERDVGKTQKSNRQIAEKMVESEELITIDIPIELTTSSGNKSYKEQKSNFDRIEGFDLEVHLKCVLNERVSSGGSSLSNSSNINQLLNDYEKNVNECVKLMNRQDNGENVSDEKIDDLLDKIEKLEKALDKQIDNMSDAQYKRYEKLDDKLTDAL